MMTLTLVEVGHIATDSAFSRSMVLQTRELKGTCSLTNSSNLSMFSLLYCHNQSSIDHKPTQLHSNHSNQSEATRLLKSIGQRSIALCLELFANIVSDFISTWRFEWC